MPANDPIIDGDTHFVGVNMRLDPGQLKPGFCASAKNKRFVNGKASTRPGIKKMPWSNKAADAWEELDSEGNPRSYVAGNIVTYSGLSAIITASTSAAVTGGTGTIAIKTTNAVLLDGDFPNGSSNWASSLGSPGWAITGNKAVHTAHSSGAENFYQDIGAVLGGDYAVTLTISDRSAGSVKVFMGQSGGTGGGGYSSPLTTNEVHTVTVTSAGEHPGRLHIQASQEFDGKVDTVSLTEGATPERVPLIAVDQITGVGTATTSDDSYHAGGPSSNNSEDAADSTKTAGPFFKSLTTNTGQPPLTSYTAATGSNLHSSATSTLDSTPDWENLEHRTYGYGTVYGAGIFRDPLSTEHVLVVASDGVYATKEGNPSVRLSGQSSFSADVDLVQCFNVVVMFRGADLEPLVMERMDTGFVPISKSVSDTDIDENDSDGTEPIPNAATGLFFSNRLLIPYNKDMVAASDFLNYTAYAPIMSNFRINQGSEDELVSLVRINNSTIACFKTNSIYIVSNIYGNLADITLDEVTREYGAVGRKSIVQIGNDVIFLSSKKGVTSLGVAANGKVSAVDVPLSEPIQPLIDRINWNYASGATAAYHNNRMYMAVPLDDSNYNNAILVYDYLAGGWAGYDTGDAVKVKEFIETAHQGKRRLFFLDTDGFINLYDDDLTECGFVDEKPKSTVTSHANFGLLEPVQISDEVVTRGYTAGDISSKKWQSAEVQLATNDPSFTINAQFDGPEEDGLELTPTGGQTFSRASYDRPFDKADYTESMVNDDFMTKYRQDYSVKLLKPAEELVDGEVNGVDIILPDGVGAGDNVGFDPDLHQQSQNRYRYRGEGRYVQLRVANTNGRAELVGAKVGAVPGQNLTTKTI